jgi:hypothetical protein
MKQALIVILFLLFWLPGKTQKMQPKTYCNPLNLDYTYMIYNSHQDLSYRSGADPAVVEFRGDYYMFVTRSMGYWYSTDLHTWEFITPQNWFFEGSNAPAAVNYKDSVLYLAGNPAGYGSIIYTDNPKEGIWKSVPSIVNNMQDPMLFIDDDDQVYLFWGSSNTYPIWGTKLDKNNRFRADTTIVEILNLDEEKHGWERFGENHSDTILGGYMEGAWLTKHNNKYYMQYAAPGTEFNVYADGVYTADAPLGPYTYQKHNPVSYKPGGFMNGAGHGSTLLGPDEQYWHFASMSLSVNVNWERRICMFPTFFDKDGLMHCDNRFGDYPRYTPTAGDKKGKFRGWMLLSYNKKVDASSESSVHKASYVNDENAKTYWLASNNSSKQWIVIDLEQAAMVQAIQVNYFDHKSDIYGRVPGLFHQYTIEGSINGKDWFLLVDKSTSIKDVPNDYVELEKSASARYIRFNNIKVPTSNLAISDIRVFGKGTGEIPKQVDEFSVIRKSDRRDAHISWEEQSNAQGYNILWGIAPDKLYSSWMVYNADELLLKSLTSDQIYYFAIETFNENGVSEFSEIIKVE